VWGKTQTLVVLILVCVVTFYIHGTGNLMSDGSALLGSLRGSQQVVSVGAGADDPVVIKDRLNKVTLDVATNIPTQVPAVTAPPVTKTQKEAPKEQEKAPARDTQAAKAELAKARKEAQIAREEAAKAVADAEAARAEASAAKAEAAKLEAGRVKAREQEAALAAQEQQEQIRLVAEARVKEDMHAAEMARLDAEAHSRDAEEQQHNQPVHGEGAESVPAAAVEHVPAAAKQGLPGPTNSLPKDYVNPYDPKPGHMPKAAQHTLPPKVACDGTMDPFPDLPVDSYEPPAGALLADKREWKDKQSAMMARVRAFNKGGKPLRDFIDVEVQTLVLLRIKLFCDLALKEQAAAAAAA